LFGVRVEMLGVMSRLQLLSDDMWARIEPLLPDRTPRRGGRWRDHRLVVEAICWRFRTGSPWRDLPAEFGAWQTVWYRFDLWAKDGTLDRVLTVLQGHAHAVAELDWVVSVDSTIARAHQHAAGARREVVENATTHTGGLVESQGSAA
jgi:transposase